MKSLCWLLLLLLTFGISLGARADELPGDWYAGLALGTSQVEDFDSHSIRHDFILGVRWNRYFGMEGSYINLGKHENAEAPDPVLRINGFGGAAIAHWPFDDHQELLLRYGLHKLDIERGFEGYEPALSRIVGLGYEHDGPEHIAWRLELQGIYGLYDRHASGKYQAVSLVAAGFYRF